MTNKQFEWIFSMLILISKVVMAIWGHTSSGSLEEANDFFEIKDKMNEIIEEVRNDIQS